MDFKPPKASKVIDTLQELINKHGDLPVCADDPDTGWRIMDDILDDDIKEKDIVLRFTPKRNKRSLYEYDYPLIKLFKAITTYEEIK